MLDYQLLYKTSFYMVAAIISIAAMIFVIIEGWLDRRQTRVYILMLFDVMLSAVGGIIYKLSQPYAVGNSGLTAFMLTFQFLDFFAHTALAPLFYLYIQTVTGAVYRRSQRKRVLYMLPFIVAECMVIVNPVVGWLYYFDDNFNFYRNWGETVTYLVAVFYFALAIFNIFFYWHAVNRRRRLGLLYCFIITILGIVIQLLSINLSVELVAESMGLMLIMLIVEREDDRIDQSTRTYNRSAFQSDLNNFFRLGRKFRIIYLRIINDDILQRLTGFMDDDSLFRQVVGFLRMIHSKYQIYRVQKDTFILVCHNSDESEVIELAELIKERFEDSFRCNDVDLRIKAMVLWANVPEELMNEWQIMQLVDGVGYAPKDNRIMHGKDIERLLYNSSLEKALHRGIAEHNYEVHYQPIYNMKDKSIYGAEASISLNDPELGTIDAGDILPLAEQQGLDLVIGNMLLDEVFIFVGSGIPIELGLEQISITVSVKQCIQPYFTGMLERLTDKYKVLPSMINFEVPEPENTEQYLKLAEVMRVLKAAGYSLSLEGYGTGYTNMQSFSTLGFDIVNMNAGLLGEKELTKVGESILRNSIHMIHDLDMKILIKAGAVREQVERIEQTDAEYLQSDYYSKVVSQNELISILRVTEMARQDEQRARAGSEAKSNFLANMSHEIRTPINAILGMNEMILRESKNEAVLSYAKDIENASRGLLSLINDILDFSKIEAGNMEIVEVEYDLSSLLNDIVNMIQMRAEQKGLSFNISVDEELPERLYGDEMRIRQVVLNLLNNAVKYTDEGYVSLSVRGVFSSDHSVRLVFSVVDTGRGIKKEDINKLFRSFQRLDVQMNKTMEGSGLGLAITNNLLNLMDGTIQVESDYGKGSTFTAAIPQYVIEQKPIGDFRRRYRESMDDMNRYHEQFIAPSAHILVVDDTPINLTVIKSLLKKTRIHIDTATSGKECLGRCAVMPYDIIFLDYRMPEMDGVTTLKIMKEMSEHPNMETPIVLLTANALSGAREQFLAAGFDDYMTKPIDGKKLEEMLIRYLPEKKVILSEELPDDEKSRGNELLEKLRGHAGLDVDQGLSNCGSVEGYREVLDIYMDSVESKAAEIERYYKEEDYENYTIQVHSLKSTSRVIGAVDISERAWELEQAGDNRDIPVIKEKTEGLINDFRKLGGKLLDIFPKEEPENEEGLAEIEGSMLEDALHTLAEFAYAMDYEDAVFVLDELKQYKISGEDRRCINDIRTAVEALDWDKVTALISERGDR